jgi:mannonate dehydratase
MEQTWRWFGAHDKVTLQDARQAGAEGIVTALHEIPAGMVWSIEAIQTRQQLVEDAGLRWTVVESLDVTEAIKTRSGSFQKHTENFISSLQNLAACGIKTVAYNFMPVFSWMRTDLQIPLDNGGFATGFSPLRFAAFDLFQLRRKDAEADWHAEDIEKATRYYEHLPASQREQLQNTILQGLPGGNGSFTLQNARELLEVYRDINIESFRANAGEFLRAVCPVAEELGMRLCVHPDDPPRSLLGLPRIVSTASDLKWIVEQSPEPANGFTFCTGALGVRADNNLLEMVRQFAPRIGFAHLRSTQRVAEVFEAAGEGMEGFIEGCHLEGDADLVGIVIELVKEERRRNATGDKAPLPFRADHGQELLDDPQRGAHSGYPAVGRLRGLAELRGAMRTAERLLPEWSAQ